MTRPSHKLCDCGAFSFVEYEDDELLVTECADCGAVLNRRLIQQAVSTSGVSDDSPSESSQSLADLPLDRGSSACRSIRETAKDRHLESLTDVKFLRGLRIGNRALGDHVFLFAVQSPTESAVKALDKSQVHDSLKSEFENARFPLDDSAFATVLDHEEREGVSGAEKYTKSWRLQNFSGSKTFILRLSIKGALSVYGPLPDFDYSKYDFIGGTMGEVWEARQASLNRHVAIKYTKGSASDSATKAELASDKDSGALVTEVLVTGALEHPNIIPVYDLARDKVSGKLFYMMKKIDGHPWDVLIDGPLDDNLEVLSKVCDAIDYTHSKGIIHRDIKPENIMVGNFGAVTLMDFGIAMRYDPLANKDSSPTLPSSSSSTGTPLYMAPEMARGDVSSIDYRTDVYLLGAVLFEICTHRPPHPIPRRIDLADAQSWASLDDDHRDKMVRDWVIERAKENKIVESGIDLSDERSELIKVAIKAMQTNPINRYKDVGDFKDALNDCQAYRQKVSQSRELAAEAKKYLEEAKTIGHSMGYEHHARSKHAFEEALRIWGQNEEARAGLTDASLAYAEAARVERDFSLAKSLLDETNSKHQEELRTIESRVADRRRQELRNDFLVVAIGILVLSLVCGSFGWSVYSNRLKRTAVSERKEAVGQRIEAKRQEWSSTLNAVRSSLNSDDAASNAKIAERRRKEASDNAFLANKNAIEAKENEQLAKRNERDAVRASYRFEISVIDESVRRNAFDEAREILAKHKPMPNTEDGASTRSYKSKLRHIEWGYLYNAAVTGLESFSPAVIKSDYRIESVAMSRNQEWIVAGALNGEALVWKRRKGRSTETPSKLEHGPNASVRAVAISDDGQFIVTGGSVEGKFPLLKIWKLEGETGQHAAPRIDTDHDAPITSVAFWHDQKRKRRRLLTSDEAGLVVVWDVTDRSPKKSFTFRTASQDERDSVWQVVPSPDDDYLVTASNQGIGIWLAESGEKVGSFHQAFRQGGHQRRVNSVLFSAEGKQLISAGEGGRVLGWDWNFPSNPTEKTVWMLRKQHSDQVASRIKSEARTNPPARVADHGGAIRSISVGRLAGKSLLATAGRDRTIKVWDLTRRELLNTLRGHGGSVSSCVVSADGTRILSGAYDGRVRYWDWQNYSIARVLSDEPELVRPVGDSRLTSSAFSPNGKWIVTTAADGTVTVWDMHDPAKPTSQRPHEGHDWLATNATIFQGGQRLLTAAGDNTARIWDTFGTQLVQFGKEWYTRELGTGWRGVATISNDTQWVATGSNDPNQPLLIWEATKTGELVWPRQLDGKEPARKLGAFSKTELTTLAFSGDDKYMLAGDADGRCHLLALELPNRISTKTSWIGHGSSVSAAKFVENGQAVITAGADGLVAKWDLRLDSPTVVAQFRQDNPVVSLNLTTDERSVVIGIGKRQRQEVSEPSNQPAVVRWNPETDETIELSIGEILRAHAVSTGDVRSVAPHPNGKAILVSLYVPEAKAKPRRYLVGIWNLGKYRQLWNRSLANADSIQYWPDGNSVLTVGGKGARRLTVNDGHQLMAFRPQTSTSHASFSHDSKFLVSAGGDGSVKIWRLASPPGSRRWVKDSTLPGGHRTAVTSAVFHPDDRSVLLTASADRTAKVWKRTEDEWTVDRVLVAHTGRDVRRDVVTGAASYSSDGKYALTVSGDMVAVIWDADGGQILAKLRHGAPVQCGSFSADQQWVITGCGSNAYVWSLTEALAKKELTVEKFEPRTTLGQHSADVTSVAFSNDSRRALTASRDLTAKVWDTSTLVDRSAGDPQVLLILDQHTGWVTSAAFSPDNTSILTSSYDGQAIIWPGTTIPPSIYVLTDEVSVPNRKPVTLAENAQIFDPTSADFRGVTIKIEHDADIEISLSDNELGDEEIAPRSDISRDNKMVKWIGMAQNRGSTRENFEMILGSLECEWDWKEKDSPQSKQNETRKIWISLHGVRDRDGKEFDEPITQRIMIMPKTDGRMNSDVASFDSINDD